jgi:hypothetical protein
MKKFLTLIACGLFLAVPPTFAAGKLQTLVYPTKAHPSFLIDIPGDWKLTPAEEEGDCRALVHHRSRRRGWHGPGQLDRQFAEGALTDFRGLSAVSSDNCNWRGVVPPPTR